MHLLALGALLPGGVRADGQWQLRPTLTLSGRHDDNPFAQPDDGQRAMNVGVEPALAVLYRRPHWILATHVGQTAERYAQHPQLDRLNARQTAVLRGESHPTRRLTAALTLSHFRTVAAGELDRANLLDLGRRAAQQRQLAPAVTYQMNRTTTLAGDLTLAHEAIDGASVLKSVVGGLRVERRGSSDRRVSVQYQLRRYGFGQSHIDVSHRLRAGHQRAIGRAIELAFEVGPRVSDAGVGAEWTTSAQLRVRPFELKGEWSESETAIVGTLAPAVVRRAGVSGASSAGRLHGRVTCDRLRTRGALRAELLRASIEATYRLAAPLSITSVAVWNRQRDNLFLTNRGDVRRTVLEMRLVFTPSGPRPEHRVAR